MLASRFKNEKCIFTIENAYSLLLNIEKLSTKRVQYWLHFIQVRYNNIMPYIRAGSFIVTVITIITAPYLLLATCLLYT